MHSRERYVGVTIGVSPAAVVLATGQSTVSRMRRDFSAGAHPVS